MSDFDQDTEQRRPRRSAWLVLVALSLVQVSVAGHQFDHEIGDLAEVCHACAQLDRLDDEHLAPSHVAPSGATSQAGAAACDCANVSSGTNQFFAARAPPAF